MLGLFDRSIYVFRTLPNLSHFIGTLGWIFCLFTSHNIYFIGSINQYIKIWSSGLRLKCTQIPLGTVAHVYNPSTWEIESRGLGVKGYHGLHKTLSQKMYKKLHICRLETAQWLWTLATLGKGPRFSSQPHMAAQLFVPPVTGDLIPLLASVGTQHVHGIHTYMEAKYSYRYNFCKEIKCIYDEQANSFISLL